MHQNVKVPRSVPSATLEALRASIGVLRWILIGLIVIYLASNIRIISPSENGLVLRFGRLTEDVHAPGLLIAFPYPIDQVIVVPTKSVQQIELMESAAPSGTGPSEESAATPRPVKETLHPVTDGYLLTGDVNLVHAGFSIRFTVSDPRQYALTAKDRTEVLRKILRDAATEAMQSIGVDEALTTGQERLRHQCQTIAQTKIDGLGLGIALQAWEIREIVPARQVLQAFEEVVSAQVEARTLTEKANAYRQARLPEIDARIFRIKQEADGQAQRTVEKARGEAASFLAQWDAARENPDAFRIRRHLEVVEQMMRRTWLPTVNAGKGLPLQLIIKPPAHEPEPITE